jgi:hypothetical protein
MQQCVHHRLSPRRESTLPESKQFQANVAFMGRFREYAPRTQLSAADRSTQHIHRTSRPASCSPESSSGVQARAARDEARKKVQVGVDPAEQRRDAKLALLSARETSFEAVARAWHRVWAEGKHARYAEDVMNRLERNVFPNFGHKPVAHMEPKDIVRMMERIQGRGANDIARRVFCDYLRFGRTESRRGVQAFGCLTAADCSEPSAH